MRLLTQIQDKNRIFVSCVRLHDVGVECSCMFIPFCVLSSHSVKSMVLSFSSGVFLFNIIRDNTLLSSPGTWVLSLVSVISILSGGKIHSGAVCRYRLWDYCMVSIAWLYLVTQIVIPYISCRSVGMNRLLARSEIASLSGKLSL